MPFAGYSKVAEGETALDVTDGSSTLGDADVLDVGSDLFVFEIDPTNKQERPATTSARPTGPSALIFDIWILLGTVFIRIIRMIPIAIKVIPTI